MQGELTDHPPILYVSGLRSGGPILDKATIKCIMEGARQPKIIESAQDILIFREVNWTNDIKHLMKCLTIFSIILVIESNSCLQHYRIKLIVLLSLYKTKVLQP